MMETSDRIKTEPDVETGPGSVPLAEHTLIVSPLLVKSEDVWKTEHDCEASSSDEKKSNIGETNRAEIEEQKVSTLPTTNDETQQATSDTTSVQKCDRQKYQCLYCDRSFPKLCSLSHHEKVHTGVRQYTCAVCCQRFNTKDERSLHEVCCKCPPGADAPSKYEELPSIVMEGESSSNLKSSMPRPRFKCDGCEVTFVSRQSLEQHTNLHLGARPFPCRYCDKSFANMGTRWGHEKTIHSGKDRMKRFPCPYCQKEFMMIGCLNKHIRVHTGDKPYKCQFCDKTFSKGNNRKRHEWSHNSNVSLRQKNSDKCIFCKKSFYRGTVNRHLKRVHGIVNVNVQR